MKMKIYFLFVVFAFPIAFPTNPNNKYCFIERCPYGIHTMCLYNKTGPHKRCERVIRAGLTNNERRKILEVHNNLRRRVFNGTERRGSPGPQLSASRNIPLEWNNELEMIAQRWVDQCRQFGDMCRNVEQYFVGQNYILEDFDEDMDEPIQLEYLQELIEIWYNEVVRFNRFDAERFSIVNALRSSTFNYTQLVWGDTTQIGCGAIMHHKVEYPVPKIFFVCNYGPSGNHENQPVYTILRPSVVQEIIQYIEDN